MKQEFKYLLLVKRYLPNELVIKTMRNLPALRAFWISDWMLRIYSSALQIFKKICSCSDSVVLNQKVIFVPPVTFSNVWRHIQLSQLRALLPSNGKKSEMLLNIAMHRRALPLPANHPSNVLTVLRMRNPGLHHCFSKQTFQGWPIHV